MRTHNFVADHSHATGKWLRELRIASAIDLDEIERSSQGPIGGGGFRKGDWSRTYRGHTVTFYSSISHSMEIDDQARHIQRAAARNIAKIVCGVGPIPAAWQHLRVLDAAND